MSTIYRRLFRLTALLLVIFASVQLSSAAPMRAQTAGDTLSALKASLTPEQQQAVQIALQKYQSELVDIAKNIQDQNTVPQAQPQVYLPFVTQSTNGITTQNTPHTAVASSAQAKLDSSSTRRVQAVLQKIEQDTISVLTPDQLVMYQSVMAPIQTTLQAPVTDKISFPDDSQMRTTALTAINISDCGKAAGNASLASRSAAYASVYAFFNYLSSGSNNARIGYNNINTAQHYTMAGLQNLSGAFVDIIVTGSDSNNLGYDGGVDMNTAVINAQAGYSAIGNDTVSLYGLVAYGYAGDTIYYADASKNLAGACHDFT